MLFKDKVLYEQVDNLRLEILEMKNRIDIQTTRISALMKAYPHGTTRTGEPRKKPGRKSKVQA